MRFSLPITILAVACSLSAQQPCFTNMVANGNFQSLFPIWTVTGAGTSSFVISDTNGIQSTRALQLAGASAFTITAPNTLTLGTGPYEFSMDLAYRWNGSGLDLGLTANGTRTSVATKTIRSNTSNRSHTRVALLFSPPAAGVYTLDIKLSVSTSNGSTAEVDNIEVHPASTGIFFNLDSGNRGVGSNSYTFLASPNEFVTVLVAGTLAGTPTPIPLCGATPLFLPLNGFLEVTGVASTNGAGVRTGKITVPSIVKGAPLYWQPIAFSQTTCGLGCADMIGFR